jgi:hypothetical protein
MFQTGFRISSEAQNNVRHLSDRYYYLLLDWMIPFRLPANSFVKLCARDNGWKNRLKYVEK